LVNLPAVLVLHGPGLVTGRGRGACVRVRPGKIGFACIQLVTGEMPFLGEHLGLMVQVLELAHGVRGIAAVIGIRGICGGWGGNEGDEGGNCGGGYGTSNGFPQAAVRRHVASFSFFPQTAYRVS
jgi:hypothetical protein